MKKVGIATYHYADNYGALLQCYALFQTINDFADCKAEVINYIPQAFSIPKHWDNQYCKKLYLRKRNKFHSFLEKYVDINKEKVDKITGEGYDYCCMGSDQVWNMSFLISPEYFLPNINQDVGMFSYAASIGILPSHQGFDEEKIIKYVSRFDDISVREEAHVQLIEDLCKKKCDCVIDPTLLLDADSYIKLSRTVKKEKKAPYLLFFWLLSDKNLMRGVELANMISRKLGIKVIHSLNKNDEFIFSDEQECMAYSGIEEFLWYVQNAEFVVTNSYHGTIFSLIFQRPFYTFSTIETRRSRIDTLANKTGIKNRIVEDIIFPDELNLEVNFKSIDENIQKEKRKALKYLSHALNRI